MKTNCWLFCVFLLIVISTPSASALAFYDSTDQIPPAVLEAAVKRASAEVQMPTTGPNAVTWNLTGEPVGTKVWVTTLPGKGKGLVAGTDTKPKPPATATYTTVIAIFPEEVFKLYPKARDDPRYLENMLYLILCHEMEHMPECPNVPTGGVPAHPTDNPPGPSTPENKYHSLRQYVRDANRACSKAAEAASDSTLCGACRCKIIHQYCEAYRHAGKRAANPVYAGIGPACTPPIPVTNGQVIPNCPTCPDGLGDCPNPKHHY